MRVQVTADSRVYLGGVVHDLTAGQVVKGTTARLLLERGASVVAFEPDEADAEDPFPPVEPNSATTTADLEETDEPPDGTAEQVLTWVGDNPDRARLALDAEQARSKPRGVLTSKLAKLADED